MAKKEFGEGAIFTITNYIWWFFLGNFYFALTNILFIFVWLGTSSQGDAGFNLLTVISLLPAGPALVALLSVMGKLVRDKDVDMTKDFFRAYKKNFFEALFYWAGLLVILSVIYVDVLYFNSNAKLTVLKMFLTVIAFIVISMALYIFPIISRFYFKVKDVLKTSFYYSIKKFPITVLNWILFVGLTYMAAKITSPFVLMFFWSVLCYLIMLNTKPILNELEEKYVDRQDGKQINIENE